MHETASFFYWAVPSMCAVYWSVTEEAELLSIVTIYIAIMLKLPRLVINIIPSARWYKRRRPIDDDEC